MAFTIERRIAKNEKIAKATSNKIQIRVEREEFVEVDVTFTLPRPIHESQPYTPLEGQAVTIFPCECAIKKGAISRALHFYKLTLVSHPIHKRS
jgi:hypothetical protein